MVLTLDAIPRQAAWVYVAVYMQKRMRKEHLPYILLVAWEKRSDFWPWNWAKVITVACSVLVPSQSRLRKLCRFLRQRSPFRQILCETNWSKKFVTMALKMVTNKTRRNKNCTTKTGTLISDLDHFEIKRCNRNISETNMSRIHKLLTPIITKPSCCFLNNYNYFVIW